MPFRLAHPRPVITLHRETLVNHRLSPTSRLLYAVLLASAEDDAPLGQVFSLVGLDDRASAQPYLDELADAGLLETSHHVGRGDVLTVHETPVMPTQRTHPCVPCKDCGACSCNYMKGVCRPCYELQRVRQQASEDIARWKRQLEAGATYALGQHATKLHRWDCPSLNTPERGLARIQDATREDAERGGVYWSRLPDLFTAEELRAKGSRKKSCQMCGPDPL